MAHDVFRRSGSLTGRLDGPTVKEVIISLHAPLNRIRHVFRQLLFLVRLGRLGPFLFAHGRIRRFVVRCVAVARRFLRGCSISTAAARNDDCTRPTFGDVICPFGSFFPEPGTIFRAFMIRSPFLPLVHRSTFPTEHSVIKGHADGSAVGRKDVLGVGEKDGSVDQGWRLRLRLHLAGEDLGGFGGARLVECRVRIGDPVVKDTELAVTRLGRQGARGKWSISSRRKSARRVVRFSQHAAYIRRNRPRGAPTGPSHESELCTHLGPIKELETSGLLFHTFPITRHSLLRRPDQERVREPAEQLGGKDRRILARVASGCLAVCALPVPVEGRLGGTGGVVYGRAGMQAAEGGSGEDVLRHVLRLIGMDDRPSTTVSSIIRPSPVVASPPLTLIKTYRQASFLVLPASFASGSSNFSVTLCTVVSQCSPSLQSESGYR